MKHTVHRLNFVLVIIAVLCSTVAGFSAAPEAKERIKVAIAGMTHSHVNGWLRKGYQDDLELVGIWEPNHEVFQKYATRYKLEEALWFDDLERLLDEQKPDAIWVFSSTYDHEKVVEACAPRGVDVIVEKPLAVNLESAERMAKTARANGIHLLTNLETSWYSSLQEAMEIVADEGALGEVNKIVSHFGHMGPVEIRCPPEFLEWLTDPVLNGGGASADFGCYGANIVTRMMGNQRPLSVTAVYQTHKPELYPKVDDDATIILEYPGMQCVIQASWDWPYSRKDIHIYGRSGVIRTIDETSYDIRWDRRKPPVLKAAAPRPAIEIDPIKYYVGVLRGEVDPSEGLSALETNLIAVEIIDAANESARTNKTVYFE